MRARGKHVAAAGLVGLVIGSAGAAGAATQNWITLRNHDDASFGSTVCHAVRVKADDVLACVSPKYGVTIGGGSVMVFNSRSNVIFWRGRKPTPVAGPQSSYGKSFDQAGR